MFEQYDLSEVYISDINAELGELLLGGTVMCGRTYSGADQNAGRIPSAES